MKLLISFLLFLSFIGQAAFAADFLFPERPKAGKVTMVKVKPLIDEVKRLYRELIDFKEDVAFRAYGFEKNKVTDRYKNWYDSILSVRKKYDAGFYKISPPIDRLSDEIASLDQAITALTTLGNYHAACHMRNARPGVIAMYEREFAKVRKALGIKDPKTKPKQ
jgi:hypothetical protein